MFDEEKIPRTTREEFFEILQLKFQANPGTWPGLEYSCHLWTLAENLEFPREESTTIAECGC